MSIKDSSIIKDHIKRNKAPFRLYYTPVTSRNKFSGVACLVKNYIKAIKIPSPTSDPELEERLLTLDLSLPMQTIRLVNVYAPAANEDRENRLAVYEILSKIIRASIQSKNQIILAGDYNSCISKEGRKGNNWYLKDNDMKNWINSSELFQVLSEKPFADIGAYTRTRNEQASIIDNFYVSQTTSNSLIESYISNWTINDHKIIGCTINIEPLDHSDTFKITDSNREEFLGIFLQNVNEFNSNNSNPYLQIVEIWNRSMKQIHRKKIPFNSKKINNINSAILKLTNMRNLAPVQGSLVKDILNFAFPKNKLIVEQVNDATTIKKWINYCSKQRRKELQTQQYNWAKQRAEFINNSHNLSKANVCFTASSLPISGVTIETNGEVSISRQKDIVQKELIQHYSSRFKSQNTKALSEEIKQVIKEQYSTNLSLTSIWPTADIKTIVNVITCSPNNACGWDNIDTATLKVIITRSSYHKNNICDTRADKFLQLFTICINNILKGEMEDELKDGIISPIYKLKQDSSELDRFNINNYRPINVLPMALRISSKIVANSIQEFNRQHKIISSSQFGFIRGKSTVQLHTIIKSELELARMNSKAFGAIFLDLKDAYTTVDWKLMLEILKEMRLPTQLIVYVSNLYKSARVSVKSEHGCTEMFPISRGVLMGEPLAPLLFDLYLDPWIRLMNKQIPKASNVKVKAYADDIVFYSNSIRNIKKHVQNGVTMLANLGLEVSIKKTEAIFINSKGKKVKTKLMVSGVQIQHIGATKNIKYLGMPLGSWESSTMGSKLLIRIKTQVKAINWKYLLPNSITRVLKSLIFSMLTYSFHLKLLEKKWINDIEACIFGFIKRKGLIDNCVKREAIKSAKEVGGLAMYSIEKSQDIIFTRNMIEMLNKDNTAETLRSNLQNSLSFDIHNSLGEKLLDTIGPDKIIFGKNNSNRLRLACSERNISITNKELLLWCWVHKEQAKFIGCTIAVSIDLQKNQRSYTQRDFLWMKHFSVGHDSIDYFLLSCLLQALLIIPPNKDIRVVSCNKLKQYVYIIESPHYIFKQFANLNLLLACYTTIDCKEVNLIGCIQLAKDCFTPEFNHSAPLVSTISAHLILQWSNWCYHNMKDVKLFISRKWEDKWRKTLGNVESPIDDTHNLLQVHKLCKEAIDIPASVTWTIAKSINQVEKLILFKRFYSGDIFRNFKSIETCKMCKVPKTSFHFYMECRAKRNVLYKMAEAIRPLLPQGFKCIFDWNLAMITTNSSEVQGNNLFILDPRGFIAKQTIINLQHAIPISHIPILLEDIYKTLVEGIRKWEFPVNKNL